MQHLSKIIKEKPVPGSKAFKRLSGAYARVFFEGGASQDDREIVLTDMAVFTNHFFPDDSQMSLEEIRENNGKRAVTSRIVRLGFCGNCDLSALYEAAVAEKLNT